MATKRMQCGNVSTSSLLLREIDSELTCAVCRDQYVNPKILPCHHSFCCECIQRLPITSDEHIKDGECYFKCPICCKHFCLPENGAGHLPTAFHLISLLTLEEELKKAKQNKEKCQKHKEVLKLFCADCNTPMCLECPIHDHKNHKHMAMDEAFEINLIPLKQKIQNFSEAVKFLSEKVENLSNANLEISKNAEECKKKIQEKTQELVDQLYENQQKLLNEVDNIALWKTKSLDRQKNIATSVLTQLQTCESLVQRNMSEWSRQRILSEKPNIMEKLEHLMKYTDFEVFQPIESTIISVQAPELTTLNRIRCTAFKNGVVTLRPATLGKKSFAVLKLISVYKKPFPLSALLVKGRIENDSTKLQIVCDIQQTDIGEFKIEYTLPERGFYSLHISVGGVDVQDSPFNISLVQRVNASLNPISIINSVKQPHAIAVFNDGRIVVADYASQSLIVLDHRGKHILQATGTLSGMSFLPKGIAISNDQHILITEGNRVLKLSSNGDRIAVFGFQEPGRAFSHLNCPTGITVHSSTGNIYIADTKNNRIQVLSPELQKPRTLINDPKCFNEPTDLAIDNEGCLYVTDPKNCCIKKFSPMGAFISKIGTKGSKSEQVKIPHSVCILGQQIYITDIGKNRALVFDLKGRFLHSFEINSVAAGGSSSIAVNQKEFIYVCDLNNGLIKVY